VNAYKTSFEMQLDRCESVNACKTSFEMQLDRCESVNACKTSFEMQLDRYESVKTHAKHPLKCFHYLLDSIYGKCEILLVSPNKLHALPPLCFTTFHSQSKFPTSL